MKHWIPRRCSLNNRFDAKRWPQSPIAQWRFSASPSRICRPLTCWVCANGKRFSTFRIHLMARMCCGRWFANDDFTFKFSETFLLNRSAGWSCYVAGCSFSPHLRWKVSVSAPLSDSVPEWNLSQKVAMIVLIINSFQHIVDLSTFLSFP